MCLTKLNPGPYKQTGVGYKVFSKLGFQTYRPMFYDSDFPRLTIGEEYTSIDKILCDSWDLKPYTSGFHLYKTLEDAQVYLEGENNSAVVKVEYSDVTAEGKQEDLSVVVARKIKLLSEECSVENEDDDDFDDDEDYYDDDDDYDEDWDYDEYDDDYDDYDYEEDEV